jgi:hypothetical protein
MEIQSEYQVFCQFCAIGKKVIKASSFEEAKQIAESDSSVHFDEILCLLKPCSVTDALAMKMDESVLKDENSIDYKSWGSE